MKKILVALSLCIFLLLSADANAQTIKEIIERKKQEAKDKANAKIDEKTSQGIDEAVNSPENIIKKKKEKKKDKKTKSNEKVTTETAPEEKPNEKPNEQQNENKEAATNDNSMTGEGVQTVIQTNIRCEEGKKKVEAMLKKQDGVFEAKTNIQNGELAIRYSSDGINYTTLLKLINEQGFDADGDKPKTGAPANPCKKMVKETQKTEITNNKNDEEEVEFATGNKARSDASRPIIETNIKCEAGKIIVTKALKDMEGIFGVNIDVKTGLLKLYYSSDGSSFNDIVQTIRDNGFDVLDDGKHTGIKKSTKPAANPCKK
ncbi:MAG: hypothetical protein WKF91_06770 [Segetibacter sp.]